MKLELLKDRVLKDMDYRLRKYKVGNFIIESEEDLSGEIQKVVSATDGIGIEINLLEKSGDFCEVQGFCQKQEDFQKLQTRLKAAEELFLYLKENFKEI